MNMLTIDSTKLNNREAAHIYIAQLLGFPVYYGHNLDALYDCLTDISKPLELCFLNTELLNSYGKKMLKVFKAASRANPDIVISIDKTNRCEPYEL